MNQEDIETIRLALQLATEELAIYKKVFSEFTKTEVEILITPQELEKLFLEMAKRNGNDSSQNRS
jgi:hypothetical protein